MLKIKNSGSNITLFTNKSGSIWMLNILTILKNSVIYN